MTVIASSLPAATRSMSRFNGDFTTVMPAAAGDPADGTKVSRHRHGHGDHDTPSVDAGRRSDGGQAWATLSIKVSQTFSALAGGNATGASSAGSAGAGDRQVADGGDATTLRMKLKIEASGSGDAFQGAMKEFVQALYGALQALFSPQAGTGAGGPPRVGTATEPIKVAPPDVAGVLPGEPDPNGAPPAAAGSGAATAAPSTAVPTATTAPTPPATTGATANPPVDDTPPVAPAAPRSVSVQMRLSYGGGLNGSLGSLVGQLAAQQSASSGGAAGSAAAGSGLAASFQRLLDASPAAAASGTTLNGFLQALARSFGQPAAQPPEPAVDPVAEGSATGAQGGKMPGTRYALAAAYSLVQGDTRMSFAIRVENGPRGPAPLATWA